jgi:hypothetical protein
MKLFEVKKDYKLFVDLDGVMADLDKMPDADQLWNYIVKYTPDILTATGSPVEKATAEGAGASSGQTTIGRSEA